MAEINVLLGKLIEAQNAVRSNCFLYYRDDIGVLTEKRNAAHDEIVRVYNQALVEKDNLLLPQPCGHPRADTVDGDGSGWCLRCQEIKTALEGERCRILDAVASLPVTQDLEHLKDQVSDFCINLVAAIGVDDEVD